MDEEKLLRLLDDYHHQRLDTDARKELKTRLLAEPELLEHLETLRFTQKGIREIGIRNEIRMAHQAYMAERIEQDGRASRIVVPLYKTRWFRVVATVALLISLVSVFLVQVRTSRIIADNYLAYHLPTMRAEAEKGKELEAYYREGNWDKILLMAKEKELVSQRAYFLTGMAAFRSEKYNEASYYFENVVSLNETDGVALFEDETDYYYTLTLLHLREYDKAVSLIGKMNADASHAYQDIFGNWDLLRIKILKQFLQ